MTPQRRTSEFLNARPRLMGIAYRLLGSVSEAEDAVQDTAYKWFSSEAFIPNDSMAWLITVCTNRCLDILKSAQRTRLDYVGPWLPEHLSTENVESVERQLEIASTLSTAFLLLLERLTPKERAAYLLHDIFSIPHSEIAMMLGVSASNSRQLSSRARRLVTKENVRYVPPRDRQEQLVSGFQKALQTGDVTDFAATLSADVALRADSGGKVKAIRHVLKGGMTVCTFLETVLSPAWTKFKYEKRMVNGVSSLLVWNANRAYALVSFSYGEKGKIQNIYIVRHPEKLDLLLSHKAMAEPNGSVHIH